MTRNQVGDFCTGRVGIGGGGGGGVTECPGLPPFGGPTNFIKRGETLSVQMHHVAGALSLL